jgi:hypothetical protein
MPPLQSIQNLYPLLDCLLLLEYGKKGGQNG